MSGVLTGPAVAIGVLAVILCLCLFLGIHYGIQKEQIKNAKGRAEAMADKKAIDEEVDSLGAADLDAEFKRWLRERR